jgi:hypothetical protein
MRIRMNDGKGGRQRAVPQPTAPYSESVTVFDEFLARNPRVLGQVAALFKKIPYFPTRRQMMALALGQPSSALAPMCHRPDKEI